MSAIASWRTVTASPALALGLMGLSSLIVALSDLPLVWDGSQFLFHVLNEQTPLFVFHRIIEAVLTAPVVAASAVTSDLALLRTTFSASYAVVPFVAVICSWVIVRRVRPELFVWAMLGIGLALLPGRAVSISESLMAAQLSWPLFLAALVPIDKVKAILALSLGFVVAVSHPVGLVFLLVAGLVGVVERRRSAAWALAWLLALVGLVVLNLALMTSRLEPYEVQSLRPLVVQVQLLRSAVGPQLAGMILTAIAAWLVYRGGRARDPSQAHALHGRAMVTVAIAAVPLLLWAAVPQMWGAVVEFRAWAVPVTLPLLLLTWLDAKSDLTLPAPRLVQRMRLAGMAATVILVVLLVQGVVWGILVARVRTAVSTHSGCVTAESIEGYAGSALESWTIVPLSLLQQSREVHAFVAPGRLCASARWPSEAPMVSLPPLRPRWFSFE